MYCANPTLKSLPLDRVLGTCDQHGVDTVEVAVFDPQEVHSAVAQQWGQHTLLLTLHKQRHEVVNLRHGHIAFVVSANQRLRGGTEDSFTAAAAQTQGLRMPTPLDFLFSHTHWPLFCFMEGMISHGS